ncbi:hypothetical protein KSP39_PZI005967 [Platanthera zijinensis]|uniref:Uncharacterized protein n=1 Tax=Platanthera zijinensis TaxID=2320716 RepID=A0AAP0GBH0_9ASPA
MRRSRLTESRFRHNNHITRLCSRWLPGHRVGKTRFCPVFRVHLGVNLQGSLLQSTT